MTGIGDLGRPLFGSMQPSEREFLTSEGQPDLELGDAESRVAILQQWLIAMGADLITSGKFDYETSTALADLQKRQGLEPTGRFDAPTRQLFEVMEGQQAEFDEARPRWDREALMTRGKDGNAVVDHRASARNNLASVFSEDIFAIAPVATFGTMGVVGATTGNAMLAGALGIAAGLGVIVTDLAHAAIHGIMAALGFGFQQD